MNINIEVRKDARIHAGIDIGWSERRRSCALALRGISSVVGWNHATCYTDESDADTIWVLLFKLSELQEFLPSLRPHLQGAIVVLDGPIGPNGPPRTNRRVDSECARQGFNGRVQPSPVATGTGPVYVDATYGVIDALSQKPRLWFGDPMDGEGPMIAETNPTVGLALMLPQLPLSELPSRNRPKRLGDRRVRAKSDWYWQRGAGRRVSRLLKVPPLAAETNHERVAGLFCLAMAVGLANENAVAIGNGHGIYVVSKHLHDSWQEDVQRVGFSGEQAEFTDADFLISVPDDAADASACVEEADPSPHGPDPFDEGRGDDPVLPLVLCDNGGIWEAHNDWLQDQSDPLMLYPIDGIGGVITLRRAVGQGQWKSLPTPINLAIARGSQADHLSRDNPSVIGVVVL